MSSYVFQHASCRLKGLLANVVHADLVTAVCAGHHRAAFRFSNRDVHTSRVRCILGQCRSQWGSDQ